MSARIRPTSKKDLLSERFNPLIWLVAEESAPNLSFSSSAPTGLRAGVRDGVATICPGVPRTGAVFPGAASAARGAADVADFSAGLDDAGGEGFAADDALPCGLAVAGFPTGAAAGVGFAPGAGFPVAGLAIVDFVAAGFSAVVFAPKGLDGLSTDVAVAAFAEVADFPADLPRSRVAVALAAGFAGEPFLGEAFGDNLWAVFWAAEGADWVADVGGAGDRAAWLAGCLCLLVATCLPRHSGAVPEAGSAYHS